MCSHAFCSVQKRKPLVKTRHRGASGDRPLNTFRFNNKLSFIPPMHGLEQCWVSAETFPRALQDKSPLASARSHKTAGEAADEARVGGGAGGGGSSGVGKNEVLNKRTVLVLFSASVGSNTVTIRQQVSCHRNLCHLVTMEQWEAFSARDEKKKQIHCCAREKHTRSRLTLSQET